LLCRIGHIGSVPSPKLFATPFQPDGKATVTLRLSKESHQRVMMAAAANRQTPAEWIEELCERETLDWARPGRLAWLEAVEHEEGSGDEAGEGGKVVPVQAAAEVEDAKDAEDGEGDHFLHDFELVRGEGADADAVGRHLEAVFKEGDAPADEDDLPEGDLAELQVTVPGEGHEDVGADEQEHGSHGGLDAADKGREINRNEGEGGFKSGSKLLIFRENLCKLRDWAGRPGSRQKTHLIHTEETPIHGKASRESKLG
jgi:hypothetical protein